MISALVLAGLGLVDQSASWGALPHRFESLATVQASPERLYQDFDAFGIEVSDLDVCDEKMTEIATNIAEGEESLMEAVVTVSTHADPCFY